MPRFYFLQTYCERTLGRPLDDPWTTLGRPSNKTKCVSNDRSGHDDSNGPRIVKIGAILAIFRPFEISITPLGDYPTICTSRSITSGQHIWCEKLSVHAKQTSVCPSVRWKIIRPPDHPSEMFPLHDRLRHT